MSDTITRYMFGKGEVDIYSSDVHFALAYLKTTDFEERFGYLPDLATVEQTLADMGWLSKSELSKRNVKPR